ncbi:MAG: hypothetical protein K0R98_161 [Rickettsiaceae bacterium]|jgi:ElaB/YqjD/DUF883 family membrane-anchored ribosome-binding protein|nr:hypothetical protein [Rickettsiaceae bacterium]
MTSAISKSSDNRGLKKEAKDISDNASDILENANQALNMGRKELSNMAEKAGKNMREFFSAKSQQVCDAKDKAEEKITANPFTAVSIAVVSGLILGALFRGK